MHRLLFIFYPIVSWIQPFLGHQSADQSTTRTTWKKNAKALITWQDVWLNKKKADIVPPYSNIVSYILGRKKRYNVPTHDINSFLFFFFRKHLRSVLLKLRDKGYTHCEYFGKYRVLITSTKKKEEKWVFKGWKNCKGLIWVNPLIKMILSAFTLMQNESEY